MDEQSAYLALFITFWQQARSHHEFLEKMSLALGDQFTPDQSRVTHRYLTMIGVNLQPIS